MELAIVASSSPIWTQVSPNMIKTVKLGGTDEIVAKTAHGLMTMTWVPTPVPEQEAFAAIKAGIDTLPPGAKMLLSSGEFYAQDFSMLNLEVLARFFEKYPSYADKAFLSVKGGAKKRQRVPDSSPENLRRSVTAIVTALRGTKTLDLFEVARVDSAYPTEDTVGVLQGFVKEGLFKYIGLSEVNATTVRRAAKVARIAAVEIEVSPWSYWQETKDVISTCEELGISVVAYSPLGRGILTGALKPENLEEGDMRLGFTRFKPENWKHNEAIVDAMTAVAAKKGITPAQLSIAWVAARGAHVIPMPGSSNAKRTLENIAGGNITLSEAELAEIDAVLAQNTVKGGRYIDEMEPHMHLWG
ncbi:aldo/keto reductase [Auriscalpium vulgare]|uniref:Aldo/keto reductase n=1 Tax=Auriscalpium vulgare TaxID=40419 RepID=A0ACB8RQR7_9AGAM|nr:aldo/keto reductase [Auriscalpium vulgare]